MTLLITPPGLPSRSRRLASGLTSLAVSLLLVVGVPVLLLRLAGWPLPQSLPSPGDIADALGRSSVSDAVIVKALALVGWAAWLMLCWTLAAELWAWLSGRPSPNLRFGGPFQTISRHLVTSVSLMATALVSPMGAQPTLALPTTPVVATQPIASNPAAVTITRVAAATPETQPELAASVAVPVAPTYTVQRRDSLWAIAETQLGDPMRWREVWDLNCNRDFDGVRFTDPNLIYPGWTLRLPEGAALAPPPTPVEAPAPPLPVPIQPAEPDVPPSTILSIPPMNSDSASPLPTTTPTSGPTRPQTPSEVPNRSEPVTADSVDKDGVPMLAVFAGGTFLATALALLLARLRRSQQRRRRPGHPPHLPRPETASIESTLRRGADAGRTDRLDVALRAFAGAAGGDRLPELAAIRASGDEVEVLLGQPAATTPPGFEDRGDHRAFATQAGLADDVLIALAGDTPPPWPTVVAAGQLGDDPVLIDLESAGVLMIDGEGAVSTVRRMITELASSPISDLIDIVVVGERMELSGSDRIRSVDSVEDGLDLLELARNTSRESLTQLGDADTPTARLTHSAEHGWGVTILVSLNEFTPAQSDRLTSFAAPRSGMAALLLGSPLGEGSWSLTVNGRVLLRPHQFDLGPLPLEEHELQQVNDLLADASLGDLDSELTCLDLGPGPDDHGVVDPGLPERSSDDPSAGESEPSRPKATSDPEVFVPLSMPAEPNSEEIDVEIKVLGPIDIDGVEPIGRRRSIELAVYLALHPEGVTAGRLKTAIWPDTELAQGTFNTTVYRARVGLGVDRTGQHHLPHAVNIGACYSLGPYLATDLARFTNLVRSSKAAVDAAEEIDLLRSAIELLRGQPFEGVTSGYEWAFTEGIITETEAMIADAAHRLAQLLLAGGDHEAAAWAAQRGLKSVPGSEPLFRDRMEAAHLAGDPAAVDRIVEELCHYVETLDPFDDLHPETIELWRRIGRPRATLDRASTDAQTGH